MPVIGHSSRYRPSPPFQSLHHHEPNRSPHATLRLSPRLSIRIAFFPVAKAQIRRATPSYDKDTRSTALKTGKRALLPSSVFTLSPELPN